jgi:4-hydroxy-tetrahydrodipicolinate reductase
MGQAVCDAVQGADDMEMVGRADPALDRSLEQVLGEAEPDVVVDFTVPDTVFRNVELCLESGTHAVVGTTGLTPEQVEELRTAAEGSEGNCLIAPNFAIGAVLIRPS